MKLLSIITACSLGLLAAQAEAEGTVAQRTIALQSGITATHHDASSATQKRGHGKARRDVVTRTQYLASHTDDGMGQTSASFVVCHPCQGGDSKGCCAVGCD